MTATVQRIYQDGWRVAIVGDAGRKYVPAVTLDAAGLSIVKLPKAAARGFQPMDYPLARAVRRFLESARAFGATKEARRFLQSLHQATKNGRRSP